MKEQIYTPREAAEKLDITVQTLWAWAKKHKIEYIKVGSRYRFQKSTIDQILKPVKTTPHVESQN